MPSHALDAVVDACSSLTDAECDELVTRLAAARARRAGPVVASAAAQRTPRVVVTVDRAICHACGSTAYGRNSRAFEDHHRCPPAPVPRA